MNKLLKCYDDYGQVETSVFFTYYFDVIPSKLSLEVSLKANKQNVEMILQQLDLVSNQLDIIFKYWKTVDTSHADNSEDFPNQYLLKSKTKKLVLGIALEQESLSIDFLYDIADTALEDWILAMNQKLRNRFGKAKTPTFNVLSKGRGGFYTEKVQTNELKIDIDKMYNDDFKEVNITIQKTLQEKRSGLILLHGVPGTGKTSYIKSLFSLYEDKNFIFIPNDFVNELLQPDFVSFLLLNKNAVILIEDAEKVIINREHANSNSVVSTILQLTDGLFSDYLNIKIICTFNTSMDKIDKALLRKGRMIAFYEFKPLTKLKAQTLMKSLGHEIKDTKMTLAEIFNYNKKDFEDSKKSKKIGF